MRRGIETFLEGIVESIPAGARDTPSPGSLSGTPGRVAATWGKDLLAGYRQDPASILSTLRSRSSRDMVAVRDIPFSSLCMHHLLPFHGRAHIVYAPDGRITGLSSLGRLVDCFSRRLQLQETLTRQIVEAIQGRLEPLGAVCVMEATHTCVTTRGARKSGTRIVTTAFSGNWERSAAARREALSVLRVGRPLRAHRKGAR